MSRKQNKKYQPMKKTTTTKQPTTAQMKTTTAAPKKKIYKPINERILKLVCNATIGEFESMRFDNLPLPQTIGNMGINTDSLGMTIKAKTTTTRPTYHLFYNRNSDILAVAHLDTYGEDYKHFQRIEDRIYNASLDDRLGAYLILSYLSHLPYDILLTIGEESGNSTAQYFQTTKQYNWIFEFDRAGADAVLYQYEDIETIDIIESFGWRVNIGSFSDISLMSHLGCKAFNLGTGYHKAHTPYSYLVIQETQESAYQFIELFKKYKDIHLPHDESMEYSRYHWKGTYYDYYQPKAYLTDYRALNDDATVSANDINTPEMCDYCEKQTCNDCPLLKSDWQECLGCGKPNHTDNILQDYCKDCWNHYMELDESEFRKYKKRK